MCCLALFRSFSLLLARCFARTLGVSACNLLYMSFFSLGIFLAPYLPRQCDDE